jgi:hypothetical protein
VEIDYYDNVAIIITKVCHDVEITKLFFCNYYATVEIRFVRRNGEIMIQIQYIRINT